jgi:hypothetical protein
MAQKDAMEQAKEVLRLLIQYRFWISVGAAALFALVAYFVGSGPVKKMADDERKKIVSAEKDVQQYQSPAIPTAQYKPIVEEKTAILDKDVNAAWKTLFSRQAPLLTWPDVVQERFRKWGRHWPEKTAPMAVEMAIDDYIEAYPAYVTMVYKTFNPFDYETGEGIVVAAPEEELLRPAHFSKEHLPDLGKVWAAQERLWIQHTLLEVVAEVNKNAKAWDNAIVRQIEALEVGNPSAQDQRSIAKNETLAVAEGIYAPGESAQTDETAAAAGGGFAGGGQIGAAMRAGMGRAIGGGGMLGAGRPAGQSESVYFVKSGNENQYKILPVSMTVLIDQDHVQDFLVELENSPMSIQVLDFELKRRDSAVSKPEKGEAPAGGMGFAGMMRGMGGMMGGRGMVGMGGMAQRMQMQMRNQMMQQMGENMAMMRRGPYGFTGVGPGAGTERKGTDKRSVKREKVREDTQKAIEKSRGPTFTDPYFDIVEVTFYGQARFFNPPPADASAPASPGDVASAIPGGNAPAAPAAAGAAPAPAPNAPRSSAAGDQKPEAAAKASGGAAPPSKDGVAAGKAAAGAADDAAPKTEKNDEDDEASAKAADRPPAKTKDAPDAEQPAANPDTPKTKPKGANPKSS